MDALGALRYEAPFEIQALAIPDALAGRDILGRAPTGSGKTLSFGLPLLATLERGTPGRMGRPPDSRRPGRPTKRGEPARPTGLILCPTRELAEQITRELESLAAVVDRTVLAVYGGRGLEQQLKALTRRRGVDLLVACPGRLLDLIDQGAVSLGDVGVVVVDEADRMSDMGFLPDVRRLLDQTSPDRQTMLYSATLDHEVEVLVQSYQRNPVEHAVDDIEPDLSLLTHRFIRIPKRDRVPVTADLILDSDGPCIVFVRTRHGTDRVARQLKQEGVKAVPLHGGRSQRQRDQALEQFMYGKAQALVATDVAARGIHVDAVARVVHYDPPAEDKDYVHRSGRTGRAGFSGSVVSLLDGPQERESRRMQQRLGIVAEIEDTPGRLRHLEPISRGGNGTIGEGTRSRARKPGRDQPAAGGPRATGPTANRRTTNGSTPAKPATNKQMNKRSTNGSTPTKPATNKQTNKRTTKRTNNGSTPTKPATNKQTNNGSTPTKPTTNKSPSGGRTTGRDRSKANAAGRSASKRSGKPRPKNRKNKPGGGRRRP